MIPSRWLFQFHKGAIRTLQFQKKKDSLLNFNSIKVRLEPCPDPHSYWWWCRNFNSIKVRLERLLDGKTRTAAINFNSIKVRLERLLDGKTRTAAINFNSIKVRLELKDFPKEQRYVVFQFHKGAIRTMMNFSGSPLLDNFNSIKVRLELVKRDRFYVSNRNFNSIKVRLERRISVHCRMECIYFNSIKVRLEPSPISSPMATLIISIP